MVDLYKGWQDKMITAYGDIARCAMRDLKAYETLIVRIRVDGVEINEILEFNGDDLSWRWLNDWYEGQKNIEYIGSIGLSEVKINETLSI